MFKNIVNQMISEIFKKHSEYVDIIILEKDDIQLAYNEKTKKVENAYDKYKVKTVLGSLDQRKIKIIEKDAVIDKEETFNIHILSEDIKIENLVKIRGELFSIKSLEITEFTGTKIYIASLIKSIIDII